VGSRWWLSVSLLAACSARLGGPRPSATSPDAGAGAQLADAAAGDAALPDAVQVARDNACGVAEMQGDLGTVSATAIVAAQVPGQAPLIYSLSGATPATAKQPLADWSYVELWDGYGVFSAGTAQAGTFAITGDETAYSTCGVCLFTLADDADGTLANAAHLLFATSGTVIVHSVGATVGAPLEIEVQDATFDEVDPTTFASLGVNSCPSPLQHVDLTGTVTTAP